ncbi:MAG: F0F1 ATP synthase subunit epsilon [Bacteroidetes bacterium]|nr:MAG: F0F1 ATP synthase subunit epsilon [Bacteroidota bacterium]
MHLEIITPETKVFSGEVDAVQLPGLDGSFQVLKGHAPIISALDAGKVKVDLSAPLSEEQQENKLIEMDGLKTIRVAIKGGVVELMNDKIIVLAE